jgi:hypothetical protein
MYLPWTLGQRQLRVVELQHALAIKPGDTTFDTEGITSEKSLVEYCLGLVVVEAETSTIRLTHFTLQEYLEKHSIWSLYNCGDMLIIPSVRPQDFAPQ